MLSGSTGAEGVPPGVHNILMALGISAGLVWMLSIARRAAHLSLPWLADEHQIVPIRGIGHRIGLLRLFSSRHVQSVLQTRQPCPPQPVSRVAIPAVLQSVRVESTKRGLYVCLLVDCSVMCTATLLWDVDAQSLGEYMRSLQDPTSPLPPPPEKRRPVSFRKLYRGDSNGSATPRDIFSGQIPKSPPQLPSLQGVALLLKGSVMGVLSVDVGLSLASEVRIGDAKPLGDTRGKQMAVVFQVKNADRLPDHVSGVESVIALISCHRDCEEGQIRLSISQQMVVWKATEQSPSAVYALSEVFGVEDGSGADCVICLTDPKGCILLPCRHICVCRTCFRQIDKCPVCRSDFDSFLCIE